MSHPGLATSAPRSWARWHSARSADTSVTWPSASAVTAIEGVVPAAGRMNNGDPVGHPRLYAAAGKAFEDDDNGLGQPARCRRGANSPDEGAGCPGPIPPPAVWARPDHVCSIDEKHTPVSPAR